LDTTLTSIDSHGLTMRQDLIDRGGFDPPLPSAQRSRQRKALALLASLALAVSIVVAVIAVSMGIAQAEIFVGGRIGDGSLGAAYLVGSLIVGAVIGMVYRRGQQRPD
jgi:hypothetical protein